MKYFSFLLFVIFCSCGSIKIKEIKDDYTQPLHGKVKAIKATIYEYRIAKNDTTVWTKTNKMEFDTENQLIKELKISEIDTTELHYKYTNGLLSEITSPKDKNNYKTIFMYDNNKNRIEDKGVIDQNIIYIKKRTFDSQNNPVEEDRKDFAKINTKTRTSYNYKQKTLIAENSIDTFLIGTVKTKMNFNKKGYITRTEVVIENTPNNYTQYEIDTSGNLIQKTNHYSDGTIKETFSYQNTYDKKENIIARKKFYNGKLVQKTTFDILYW
jgi:hypothetical protein